MAVFRVNKTNNYTVMSNHHLQNNRLSLKSKGLLSLMLSLPDSWDYSLKGLAAICLEGIDAIRTAVKELEKNGYIIRRQLRDDKGRIIDVEYTIYERPQKIEPESGYPELENPILDNPILEEPITGKPKSEKPTQLNTKELITKELNTKYNQSIDQGRSDKETSYGVSDIKMRIEYAALAQIYGEKEIMELVEIVEEIECQCKCNEKVRIGESYYPSIFVAKRFGALNFNHICYVMDCLGNSKRKITNIKNYLITALFNSTVTIQQFYDSEVRHDLK